MPHPQAAGPRAGDQQRLPSPAVVPLRHPWLSLSGTCVAIFLVTLIVVEVNLALSLEDSLRNWIFHAFRSALPINLLPFLHSLSLGGVVDDPEIGAVIAGGVVMALLCIALVLAGRPWSSMLLLTSLAGAALLATASKRVIVRPPPLNSDNGHTFPSGHACAWLAFVGCLAYLAWREIPGARLRYTAIGALALVFVLGILSTLTFHYPSDVLGGCTLGGGWLALLIAWFSPRLGREARAYARRSTDGSPDRWSRREA